MNTAAERAGYTVGRIRILQNDLDRSKFGTVYQRDFDTGGEDYSIPVTAADIGARIDCELQLLVLQRSSIR